MAKRKFTMSSFQQEILYDDFFKEYIERSLKAFDQVHSLSAIETQFFLKTKDSDMKLDYIPSKRKLTITVLDSDYNPIKATIRFTSDNYMHDKCNVVTFYDAWGNEVIKTTIDPIQSVFV